MFSLAVFCLTLALVQCQDTTTVHPHHTRHPHTATGTTIAGQHTFSTANPRWFLDTKDHMIILKTASGCYGAHLTHALQQKVKNADELLEVEKMVLVQIEHAGHFTRFLPAQTSHLHADIQTACPVIHKWHNGKQ